MTGWALISGCLLSLSFSWHLMWTYTGIGRIKIGILSGILSWLKFTSTSSYNVHWQVTLLVTFCMMTYNIATSRDFWNSLISRLWLSLQRTVNWVSNIIGVLCLLGTLILLDSSNGDANWMPTRSGESVSHPGVNFYASGNIPHRCSYMLISKKHLVVFTNQGLPHSIHVKLLPVIYYEFGFPATCNNNDMFYLLVPVEPQDHDQFIAKWMNRGSTT